MQRICILSVEIPGIAECSIMRHFVNGSCKIQDGSLRQLFRMNYRRMIIASIRKVSIFR